MTGGARRTTATVGIVAALGALAALAYANSFTAGFTLDSRFIILEDPRLRQATAENVGLILGRDYWWPKAASGLYRPVTTLSYLANYAVLGNADRPAGYHAVNLLLHWANASAAFLLVCTLTGAFWPAFAAAALFAVHPVGTEAVTSIVGRADLLAALSVLAGSLLYVHAARRSGRARLACLLGVAATTLVGVFSKESAVAIAGVVVVHDLLRLPPGSRRDLPRRLRAVVPGWLVLAPPFLVLALVRWRLFAGVGVLENPFLDNPLVAADFLTARATAMKVVGRGLALLAWPATLSCDYSYAQIPMVDWRLRRWEDWQAPLALLAVAAVALLAVRRRRHAPAASFLALFCLVTLLPTSNLLLPIGTIMAERLLYLPMVGFAACVALAADALGRRLAGAGRLPRVGFALVAVLLVAATVRTLRRNADWHDDLSLWTSAVAAVPQSARAHERLAYALAERQGTGPDHMERILAEAETALAIVERPPLPAVDVPTTIPLELGVYYEAKGSMVAHAGGDEQAAGWYRRAAAVLERAAAVDRAKNAWHHERARQRGLGPAEVADVGNYEVYEYLGRTRLLLDEPSPAREAFVAMRRLSPAHPEAHMGVARAELALDRPAGAAVALLEVVALDPRRQEAWRLLLDVYARLDPGGCALAVADARPRLDLGCPLVHEHLCTAFGQLVALHQDARQPELAQRLAERATREYRCPADALQRTPTDS